MLNKERRQRYGRNLTLPDFSDEDQEKLLRSSALLIGVGGLGSPISLYLAAMGLGRLTIVESDRVELSNLQRQIVLDSKSINMPKVEVATRRLKDLNPDMQIDGLNERFDRENARRLVASHDMTIDASDNFSTKFLVNDASLLEKKPFSIGSVQSYHGQASTYVPDKGPCYRCLFKNASDGDVPTTPERGVFGTVSGVIGVIQATEVFKVLLGKGRPLIGKLLLFDALEMDFQTVMYERDTGCSSCGFQASIDLPR